MSTNVIKVAVKPWLKLIWLSGFLILAVCPVVAFLKSTGMERMIQILIFSAILAVYVWFISGDFIFLLKIENDFFTGRSKTGKKYKFHCSEIKKIKYSARTKGKYQTVEFSIIIETKTMQLKTTDGMTNFSKLAAYLLEQREAGVLKKSAIAPFYLNNLKYVAEGTHLKMLKKK